MLNSSSARAIYSGNVQSSVQGLLKPMNPLQSLLNREMRTTFVQIGKVGEMPLSRCEALEIINNVLMLDGSSAHSTRMEYDITAGCQCYALLN